jgi:hypothetical protein
MKIASNTSAASSSPRHCCAPRSSALISHTFYSVPRINVISASGWSEAFVSASVLARKSHYSSEFLNIHAASYYEVFWTYKNNIAGGISAHVSACYPTRDIPINRRVILTQGLWRDEDTSGSFMKLGGSVFYGCGRIRDGRYLYFKYPTELHQGSHRATSLISLPAFTSLISLPAFAAQRSPHAREMMCKRHLSLFLPCVQNTSARSGLTLWTGLIHGAY